jgi:hypothetical protein
MNESIFLSFLNKKVKAPYKDGTQFKIARGRLVEVKDGFVKIEGPLGTLIINQDNIEKMSLLK